MTILLSRRACVAGLAVLPVLARAQAPEPAGGVQQLDPALARLIDPALRPEVLGRGYRWAEGPVWVRRGNYLLFADVPGNRIWRWRAGAGLDIFMEPSGLVGPVPDAFNEAGANGLAIDPAGRLVMADSGTRAVARLDLATRRKTILVDRYEGKRFNSPNTVAVARSGAIFFSDPPYGLKDQDGSPLRELDFQGLYRLDPDGSLHLLDRSHRRPNGIAISPDQRTLYLALSDETRPEVLAYPLDARGNVGQARVFSDMRAAQAAGGKGLPDGMVTDRAGNLFATGPGGVHVLTPAGKRLGIIATGKAVANCCFGGPTGSTLFMTSHDTLQRVETRTRGW
ncbi:gluconolactonase [Sphingomonas guangdongensis]|uniref:Gluconolactonase n=1 Tax=Sphingomonas guangdongensis TaxID=1141890 RepID=A0A285QX32_9SPHN|nr:SMP-30/gluconolactonase/LRE family protein [Sphingomonas guangdongensis]SOB86535.1 gluconolactonase [Sphingomonas guangdongensis]